MTVLRLAPNGPCDFDITSRVLAAHAIPGAEEFDLATRSHTRLLTHIEGQVRVKIRFTGSEVILAVPDDLPDVDRVTASVRRWLDLDADIVQVADHFRADPIIGPLVASRPGVRLVGYPNEFEAVVATVIGQQVSLAAARTFLGRLVTEFGTPIAGLLAFPRPQELAAIPAARLQGSIGLTGTRSRALHALAQTWSDGFTLAELNVQQTRRALLAMPGIGPWTADYLAVRAMQHPDTFAPGDLVARKALGAVTVKQATELSAAWTPFRSYALANRWAHAAYGPTATQSPAPYLRP
ncbi:MAG: DNA-3-methyladenine glycosylase family protein [Sciscionella sp.]